MRCCFRLEIAAEKGGYWPSISVKLYLFFLSLETSTVAFRTVLNELLFFFLALNLASFQYFCQEYSFFAFLFAFQRKFAPKIPAKIPRNRQFSLQICLFKSREISLFSRELSEALINKLICNAT